MGPLLALSEMSKALFFGYCVRTRSLTRTHIIIMPSNILKLQKSSSQLKSPQFIFKLWNKYSLHISSNKQLIPSRIRTHHKLKFENTPPGTLNLPKPTYKSMLSYSYVIVTRGHLPKRRHFVCGQPFCINEKCIV